MTMSAVPSMPVVSDAQQECTQDRPVYVSGAIIPSVDAKMHPNPQNMVRAQNNRPGIKPPSKEYAIPSAVAFHLIAIGMAKTFQKSTKDCMFAGVKQYPRLVEMALQARILLPNVSIRRLFPEIPHQALPAAVARIKKVKPQKEHALSLKTKFHRAVRYAVDRGLDNIWTTDPDLEKVLIYIPAEEADIYKDALSMTLDSFKFAPYKYKTEKDPMAAEFAAKGNERSLALQRYRLSKNTQTDELSMDGAVQLCAMSTQSK